MAAILNGSHHLHKKTSWHFPPHHLHKKTLTHSFWLSLMMAAILNLAILDSDPHVILDSKFNLMMAAILKTAILNSPNLHKTLTQTNSIWLKLIHSHITWWWQPSWILLSWIHPFCPKLWLKLIQSDSNSFILIQLDDGSHLEFCYIEFTHLAQNSDSN